MNFLQAFADVAVQERPKLDPFHSINWLRVFKAIDAGDHIAVAVAESDDLVALDLLVAAETEVVAALLGGHRRAVAVDDIGVEQMRSSELHYTFKSLAYTMINLRHFCRR